jgi:uncharacterized protein with FMN-binding domain
VPIRGTLAVIATVIAIALMASFKTPDVAVTHPSRPAAIGAAPPTDSGNGSGSSGAASPSPAASATPSSSGYKDGSYDGGTYSNQYGDVQVRVIINGGKITDVQPLTLPSDRSRSYEISQEAGPMLHDEVVQAQSAQIDTIGGATYTSDGYARSVQSALDKAHA